MNVFNNLLIYLATKPLPCSLFNSVLPSFTPIFMLHRIERGNSGRGQPITHIRRCLRHLRKSGYHPLRLDEYAALLRNGDTVPDRSVIFTVDDGFVDQIVLGGEVFSHYDVPLTCFVVTDFLDGKIWPWFEQVHYIIQQTALLTLSLPTPDGNFVELNCSTVDKKRAAIRIMKDRIKNCDQGGIYSHIEKYYVLAEIERPSGVPSEYEPASWEDASRFARRGHEIAAHTKTHRVLSRLSDSESRSEIIGSIARLREMGHSSLGSFAYPNGRHCDYNQREIDILKEVGIQCAVNAVAEHALHYSPMYHLPRFPLPDEFGDFLQCLTYVELLKKRIQERWRSVAVRAIHVSAKSAKN